MINNRKQFVTEVLCSNWSIYVALNKITQQKLAVIANMHVKRF